MEHVTHVLNIQRIKIIKSALLVYQVFILWKEPQIALIKSIPNIILTKKLLLQAHDNFEFAENDLIDYYTYNIKANQAKLDYLIKQAKANGLIIDDVG